MSEEVEVVTRTEEQLAQDYSAMGDSVAVITDVIAGDSMAEDDAVVVGKKWNPDTNSFI